MTTELTIIKVLDDEQTAAMAHAVARDVLQSRESGDPLTIFHRVCDAQIAEAVTVYRQLAPEARKAAFAAMREAHEKLATRLTLALGAVAKVDDKSLEAVTVKLAEVVDLAEAAASAMADNAKG